MKSRKRIETTVKYRTNCTPSQWEAHLQRQKTQFYIFNAPVIPASSFPFLSCLYKVFLKYNYELCVYIHHPRSFYLQRSVYLHVCCMSSSSHHHFFNHLSYTTIIQLFIIYCSHSLTKDIPHFVLQETNRRKTYMQVLKVWKDQSWSS